MLTYREADEYTAPDVEAALRANPANTHGRRNRPWCYHCNKLLAEKGTVIVCNRCKVRNVAIKLELTAAMSHA